jgi:hypothetical protein
MANSPAIPLTRCPSPSRGARRPKGETVTGPNDPAEEEEEIADIERQVTELLIANEGRGPGEQVSVAPEDVN